jgi:2-hydroxychromene-2-carboxylate isomerase/cation transport regulator ChaC
VESPLWYFAYGSNLSLATFTGRRCIQPLQTRWGWLEDYRLCFDLPVGRGQRGVANLCAEAGARTCGALYLITPADAAHLDRTEGVHRGFYERLAVTVALDGGETVAAFAYQSPHRDATRRPSARYVGLLLEGARQHGLPADYLSYLEGLELAIDEREQSQEGFMAEKKKVRFYFAYNSPYAFLASQRLEKELAPYAPEVEYKPVYSPRSGGGPDPNSPRIKYVLEDIRRFAAAYGLQLKPGPFADSKKACIGFLYANAHGRGRAYHDRVYCARWLEGQDIANEETLAAIAEQAGFNRAEFLAALADPRYEAALLASNQDAQADGAFGFPFFLYEGKRFWGNDRLEWLVREMAKS